MGWYQRVLARTGRAPAVWMLIGFLVTFAATRAITHRIRARRRYSGAKLARARSGAYQLRRDRLRDLPGGRPDPADGDHAE